MNINEPTEPGRDEETSSAKFGDDDHVEVLVQDLFIEEYQAPLTLAADKPIGKRGRLHRAVQPIRSNAKSLLGGLFAVGGLALATLFFAGRRRKTSPLTRLFLKLGIARG